MSAPRSSLAAVRRVALAIAAAITGPRRRAPPAGGDLRVMTFNIWHDGGRSLPATIDVIRAAAPDVVALQECTAPTAARIARALGVEHVADGNGRAILSPHRLRRIGVIADASGGIGALGADVLWGTARIHAWNAHLHWAEYGPRLLRAGCDEASVLATERRVRMPILHLVLDEMAPSIASGEPTFLLGDFNAPSHLDYAGIAWPESLTCEARGLADSYRALHPHNRLSSRADPPFAFDEPGVTWTPILAEEPHGVFDRIDFIHYAAANRTTPSSAVTLDGRSGASPWPSDHRAVLSTFTIAGRYASKTS